MIEEDIPPFIPGLDLAEDFYRDAVRPILADAFPGLEYSAALIGPGSEVLGFDTEMSADHNWGPRVMLFLQPPDFEAYHDEIRAVLAEKLPREFHGYSTNFTEPDPDDNGTQLLRPAASGPINHRVETYTIPGFFSSYLGVNIDEELDAVDWLTLPQQKLRSIVSGAVFHDDIGLEQARHKFTWYPRDAWLYILASLWARIGQEEHLMGRAGTVGDDIGSGIIASRIVRDIMRLAILMEKQYPPYAKWLGTAFYKLDSAYRLEEVLEDVLRSKDWEERDGHLSVAYSILAEMHNALGITAPLPEEPNQFFGRPFTVIWGDKFKSAILDSIDAPWLTPVLRRSPIGSVDTFMDNTDMLEDPAFRPSLRRLYE